MSITTYPPKARITRPTDQELKQALKVVEKHVVDWWHPWPDEVSDNTIRWLRKHKLVVATSCSGALQMAQNNFGHSWVEDAITDGGREVLRGLSGG